mgnify:FL=1
MNINSGINQKISKARETIASKYNHIPLAFVHSFGCQQNVSDAEKIKGILASIGYGMTNSTSDADLVIYNTCAVRENAQDKVFGVIGELKHEKRNNPDMLIGICGCMVQQEHISERIKKSYPHVDLIFGTNVLHELPDIIHNALDKRSRVVVISDDDSDIIEGIPIKRDSNFKAWVPIMNGCNNFCTYCVVPYVRGREKSRQSKSIIAEVRELVASGYKDITLLGQNVNSYGKGLDESITFAGLLQKLNEIEGDFRINFMTSHPKDATFELIDTIAECDKVSKFLHLPVQCGSDRILKKMNRHYTVSRYMELIEYAKKRIPDVALSSDIIVGFPGETHSDFLETLDLIKQVGYINLYTFIYSRREGTKAALMEDVVNDEQKGEWFTQLLSVQKEIARREFAKYVGKQMRILVDGSGKTDSDLLTGRTEGNIIVDFDGDKNLIGDFVRVKIVKSLGWALIGEIIQ